MGTEKIIKMFAEINNLPKINEGDFIIIKKENASHLVHVSSNRPVFISKRKLSLGSVIGCPFGSLFELKGKDLVYIEKPQIFAESIPLETDEVAENKDNRFLVDDGKSQKLTKDEIECFKAKGVSGEEIVGTLVENSTTFKEKSLYSQEKYLKKKRKKYSNFVQIFQPTTRLLAEIYYSQGPLKICNLRLDTLSQMLTLCNVMSGGKYIVVDAALGLLVAAVLEKLGNQGCVVQMYAGEGPVSSYRQAIHALNLSKECIQSLLFGISFNQAADVLYPNQSYAEIQPISEENIGNGTECQEPMDTDNGGVNNDIDKVEKYQPKKQFSEEKEKEKFQRRMERQREKEKAVEILKRKDIDGLLIATKHHPTNIALSLLDSLAFSRPFVIFCMYQPPLIDCYVKLKNRGDIINLNLTETWLRNYQVLPERTHPDISMSGTGGYLLSGIKVAKH